MDIESEIERLKQRASTQSAAFATEEATKTGLVLPLLRALGYDVFDPTEVIPEFTADVGTKKGEKVDFAICHNGRIGILIECKKAGSPLDRQQASQLYRYFTVTDARFGVLTDGVRYEFYSDLDQPNRMDDRHFFLFDLMAHSRADLRELAKFGKQRYAEDSILATASDLKYGRLVEEWLQRQMDMPAEDLVRLIGASVYQGRMTAQNLEWLTRIVRDALERVIDGRVRGKLEKALSPVAGPSPGADSEPGGEGEGRDGIVTTPEEEEAVRIIRAIVAEVADPDRVAMRDAKSYCAVLLDDNNRRPLARLYLEGRQWRVGTFRAKEETRHDIARLADIYALRDTLKAAVLEYDGPGES